MPSSAALFDLLPDFGARPPRRPLPLAAVEPEQVPEPQAPGADITILIAEAVAEAEAALEARLSAEHHAAMEAQRLASEDASHALLAGLGNDVGAAIARRIDVLESRVTDLVAATVARIVGGVLSDDLQKRSLDALARALREATGDSEAMRIVVRGPSSLFETLREALGSRAANLDFVEAASLDLTVTIDETVFETRIAEWSATLSEVLS